MLFWAERTVPSGVAAVLIATLPLWTVLVESALVKGRRVTPGLIAALVTGFVGVLFLAQGSDSTGRAIPWLPCTAIVLGEPWRGQSAASSLRDSTCPPRRR